MTRFQLCSGSLIAQAASLRLDAIPNTYRKPRLVNSSRPPRALEVIGDPVASWGAGSGLGGWFSLCHSAFLFIHSWLANVCTPLPFHSATDEVVAQTFYFNCILARKYDHHCSNSNQHIAGVEGCQLQHMKKQGHSTIAKGCRQRDMKDKILQALFEDRTRCVHTATMTKYSKTLSESTPSLFGVG